MLRHLAAALDMDTPMYSKIERGDRPAKRTQVIALAKLLSTDETELLVLWLDDKIIEADNNKSELAIDALESAQQCFSPLNNRTKLYFKKCN